MTPAEALKTINNADGCKYCDIGEALGVAIDALREKVEREAEKNPNGPSLEEMSLFVGAAANTYEGPALQLSKDNLKAAAQVLRKLDEWLKSSETHSLRKTNNVYLYEGEMNRYLGLPERDP